MQKWKEESRGDAKMKDAKMKPNESWVMKSNIQENIAQCIKFTLADTCLFPSQLHNMSLQKHTMHPDNLL